MNAHTILVVLALACTFMTFIQKPAMPVSIGWLGIFLLTLDFLMR